jgi:hypothetical protein
MCRYWHGRGLSAILISGLLNVLALAFTITFSTFLLLFVNWSALHSECIVNDTCDIASAVIYSQVEGEQGSMHGYCVHEHLLIGIEAARR